MKSVPYITTRTIQEEIKIEFFEALRKRLNEDADFFERERIKQILKEDQMPIERETIRKIARYYGMRRNKDIMKHYIFTRPEAQLIKKTIREVYLLGI